MEVSPEFLLYMSFIGTASTALMELLKRVAPVPIKYIPLFTLGIGVVLALMPFPFVNAVLAERVWAGVLAGLGGTGMFENLKQSSRTKGAQRKNHL